MIAYNGETMGYDALDRQYRNTNAGARLGLSLRPAPASGSRSSRRRLTVLRREMARLVAEANMPAEAAGPLPDLHRALRTTSPARTPTRSHIKPRLSQGDDRRLQREPPPFCPDARSPAPRCPSSSSRATSPTASRPRPATGTFQDVTCSGPYATFAPWIEQLYSDGVTAGCSASPLQFCPGNVDRRVGDARLAREGPAAAPGAAFLGRATTRSRAARSILFATSTNRIVTEMAGGTSGAATATLSVTRDNVFLGNLLVASYVASPAGWQYTDLGSPRQPARRLQPVRARSSRPTSTGPTAKTRPATTARPAPRLLPDGARHRATPLLRPRSAPRLRPRAGSCAPDRVGGTPANPQSWNRYAYTLNNPMKHVDPDGRLTILVHGTWASSNPTFQPGGKFFLNVKGMVHDRTMASLKWSGGNTTWDRRAGAEALASYIRSYKFAPGEQLNLVAHSHGGNLSIQAINMGLGRKVDNLMLLGTPSRPGYKLESADSVGNFVNFSKPTTSCKSSGASSTTFLCSGSSDQLAAINPARSTSSSAADRFGRPTMSFTRMTLSSIGSLEPSYRATTRPRKPLVTTLTSEDAHVERTTRVLRHLARCALTSS